MKLIHIIALALAFSASYPVYAQANKSGVKTFASRQEDPSPIEITAYENRIKVENAPVGSILEIYSVVGINAQDSNRTFGNFDVSLSYKSYTPSI